MQKLIDKLVELGACSEAIIWVKKQESLQAAWENCNNFEWLHWLLNQLDCKGQTDKIRETYNTAVAQAWAAYDAAVAQAEVAYCDAIAPARAACDAGAKAAYNTATAQARAAYIAAVAQARAAYYAAIASINCEFCNPLREIVSFEDVLKHGNF